MSEDRLFSQVELDQLCVSGDELVRAALASRDVDAVERTYALIEDARRGHALIHEDWALLTSEYLFEAHGHEGHAAKPRLERTTELAVRRGMSLDDLETSRQFVQGPENPLRATLHESLEAGDFAAAEQAWQHAEKIMRLAQDTRQDYVSLLLDHVYRAHGENGLQEAMLYAADRGIWGQKLPRQSQADLRELVAETAFYLIMGIEYRLRITEDDDRFTFELFDCHCGRQAAEHEANGWDMAVIYGPSPLTYGQRAMSTYQAHLAVMHGIWPIDKVGAPVPAFDCSGIASRRQPCRNYIFKHETPARYYQLLGRTKPPTT